MKRTSLSSQRKPVVISRTMMFWAIFAIAYGALLPVGLVKASVPKEGTVNPVNNSTVTWTGDSPGQPPAANGEATCQDNPAPTGSNTPYSPGLNCDVFTLNVSGTSADWTGKRVRIRFTWIEPGNDFDMVVRKESGTTPGFQPAEDSIVTSSGNGTNTFEEAIINPQSTGVGIYYVRSVYFAFPVVADQYNGTATTFLVSTSLPAGQCALPTYDNYQPPANFPNRNNAGEPSIGVNWNTGNVMLQERLTSVRATFNDSTSPTDPTTGVSWYAARPPAERTGLDPILFTDHQTGRTIGGELIGLGGATDGGISDDDLSTFVQTFQTGGAVQGFDHQTIGGGPPKRDVIGRQPTTSYPHLFYYASQQIAYGSVATSFDGGITYQSAVTAYTAAQCNGLHGHIKVAPDGTVYLPNKNCQGKAAVVVSEDNGLTWEVRPIQSSSAGKDDPAVGIGAGGKVYVSYTAADQRTHVVVSDDKGKTWHDDNDLGFGIPGGMKAGTFPAVTAGDNNRAAVFFHATNSLSRNDPTGTDGAPTTGADPTTTDNFFGTWYPYIATTCDGGKSWSVVRADNDPLRPGVRNPVQQGVICKNGTTCPGGPPNTRNLLDFMDVTVDRRGRVLATYADGCITDRCINLPEHSVDKSGNDGTATLTVIRQRGGMRLFAEFDPISPGAPALSPPVQVEETIDGKSLSWTMPDDNGLPIKRYRIYRGAYGQRETLLAEVAANVYSYRDRDKKRGVKHYYHVTAVNALGESPRNAKAFALKGE